MVGVATINGKEIRIHYGMTLAEQFSNLMLDNSGKEIKVKKPSTVQVLACIIFYGHENWCDLNDEVFSLKRSEVFNHVENAYSAKDEKALEEFAAITEGWTKSTYVADLIKAGKEVEDEKKKVKRVGSKSNEPLTVS
jgi:hypothetical protein